MSILVAKSTLLNSFFSSHGRNQRQNSVTFQNSLFCGEENAVFIGKRYATSSLLSSNLLCSCTMMSVSAFIPKTRDNKLSHCNTTISEFCKAGNLKKAMELLCTSPKTKLESSTYCTVLQLCAELNSLENGKKVHSLICSNGIMIDAALGTRVVFMYLSCGELREGRRMFDKVANEKVFLWNLMMSSYAKNGNFRESIYLFEQMLDFGVEVNSHTFSCVLKCYAALESSKEGQWVHGYLLKLGLGPCNSVVNSLMTFYMKIGMVETARKLFDELIDRDVISWNSMISGYVANGLSEKGLEVLVEMLCRGTDVDLATMVCVLPACANCCNVSLATAVHALAIKSCLDTAITFRNALMDTYAKSGRLDDAVRVFERMEERNVISWTSMIAGYAREGLSVKAIGVFHEMIKQGVRPDVFTVTTVLHTYACNGSLENGREVHDYIRENDMQSNIFVCNALMDMYAKCGSMEDANSVFLDMPIKDNISWNTMIGGYAKNGLANEALILFAAMVQESKPDSTTVARILPACASLAALDKGREIHGHLIRNGYSSDQCVANALVDMYVKCGVLITARMLFDMIRKKDLVSWTVMISGYGMHGFGSEAIAAFNEMRQAGTEPDAVAFVSILYACSHSGLIDEGWRFFNMMRNECNIEPLLEHYACIVDLLSRKGKLQMAYQFIKSMPIEQDATIWGSLLSGCRVHRDVKLAEKVAERVFELEPENTGYYVLLANVYAEAEKWKEMKKMREKIGRRGLKKNPGCSWIEIQSKVHIFVAGDRSNPQTRKIESLLKRFREMMKEEGCFPKTKHSLINADHLQKEIALCGHSEKLAIAFGILTSPPGKTLRVTKNLRVCADCHEMAKFISKTSGREIVLRDSNRFHHFKDGICCCRGFW